MTLVLWQARWVQSLIKRGAYLATKYITQRAIKTSKVVRMRLPRRRPWAPDPESEAVTSPLSSAQMGWQERPRT